LLSQIFADFARGATSPSAWDVLALLDQYHRRGKLSAELCQTMRHQIERQLLEIEELEAIRQRASGFQAVSALTLLTHAVTLPRFCGDWTHQIVG
jgi:hypothetical protein